MRFAILGSGLVLAGTATVVTWAWAARPAAPPGPLPRGVSMARASLPATTAPLPRQLVRLAAPDVQESCVGRDLPGDAESVRALPAMIDGNPRTSWHCDGDGARLRPPQSLTVFFPRTLTLAKVGVLGYDPLRPCRFVTSMALVSGRVAHLIFLPTSVSAHMRWYAMPSPVPTREVTLVVLATAVPAGRTGPACARTAIDEVSFAGVR